MDSASIMQSASFVFRRQPSCDSLRDSRGNLCDRKTRRGRPPEGWAEKNPLNLNQIMLAEGVVSGAGCTAEVL